MTDRFCVAIYCEDQALEQRLRAAIQRLGIAVLPRTSSPIPSTGRPDVIVAGLAKSGRLPLPPDQASEPDRPPILLALAPSVPLDHRLLSQAADFLREPFNDEELAARLTLLFQRRAPTQGEQVLQAGEISVNLDRYEVRVGGLPVDLTPKEYQLLCYLLRQSGRACTRQQLLEAVWGYDYFGGTRTVDIHVQRLRAKLGESEGCRIETVRSVGYRLRP